MYSGSRCCNHDLTVGKWHHGAVHIGIPGLEETSRRSLQAITHLLHILFLSLGWNAWFRPPHRPCAFEFVRDREMNWVQIFHDGIVVRNVGSAKARQHRLPIDCGLTMERPQA